VNDTAISLWPTCTMAQLSAGAATEVIAAGGMDTSISKKKRRRNKKDRGLAGKRREIWITVHGRVAALIVRV
jgi:hypothetical protein